MKPKYKHERFHLFLGKSENILKHLPSNSVHAVVCDPPYELGFMGKSWDSAGIAYNVDMWKEVLRVLKPGGHLLAFSGSRTYHRMTCAIEDAGFEIRDQIIWLYGSGFPKSQNVSKAIDKAAGAEREVIGKKMNYHSEGKRAGTGMNQHGVKDGSFSNPEQASLITAPATREAQEWDGWGTALKPAHEPICVARKPLAEKTVAKNVVKHRAGAMNIDASRIPLNGDYKSKPNGRPSLTGLGDNYNPATANQADTVGRFPANVIHDGSDEVVRSFPNTQSGAGTVKRQSSKAKDGNQVNTREGEASAERRYTEKGGTNFSMKPGQRRFDDGSAARFFYCAKAAQKDRNEGLEGFEKHARGALNMRNDSHAQRNGMTPKPRANTHPTVKPTELMRYLVRLVTPPNGIVLDPFMGSGSTGKAAMLEGFKFAGIDMTPEYVEIAHARIKHAHNQGKK